MIYFPPPPEVDVVLEVETDQRISIDWLRALIADARAWEEKKEAA